MSYTAYDVDVVAVDVTDSGTMQSVDVSILQLDVSNPLVFTGQTNSSGVCHLYGLPLGRYSLICSFNGYYDTSEIVVVPTAPSGWWMQVAVYMTPLNPTPPIVRKSLYLYVWDQNDNIIQGAYVAIADNNGTNFATYTNSSGLALFPSIPVQNYAYTVSATLHTTRTGQVNVNNYNGPNLPYTVVLDGTPPTTYYTLTVTVKNQSNVVQPNIAVEVVGTVNYYDIAKVTNGSGVAQWTNIAPDTYTVRSGDGVSQTTVTITNADASVTLYIQSSTPPATATVTVQVRYSNGGYVVSDHYNRLAITLRRVSDNVMIGGQTSDDYGNAVFTNIPTGVWYYSETNNIMDPIHPMNTYTSSQFLVTASMVFVFYIPNIKNTPTISTITPVDVVTGTGFTDQALLTGATPTAGGTVTYYLYEGGFPGGSVVDSHAVTVNNATVPQSKSFIRNVAGNYYFMVTYSGDGSNNAIALGIHEDFVITTAPIIIIPPAPLPTHVGVVVIIRPVGKGV